MLRAMNTLLNSLLAATACLPLVGLTGQSQGDPRPAAPAAAQKAVLVTGASTGIGRKITERLAGNGYFVYAGARKEADLKALNEIKNVQALRLDVTKQEEIDAAVATIRQGGRGLYGLVNNAGVVTLGSLADMKPEEFDLVMQVNAYGPYRVSRAMLPLITESRGRITIIGSISGILASPALPAYSMSKHAMEAFVDSVAAQLKDSGVTVNIVEPGNYNSDIGKNALARSGADPKDLPPGAARLVDRSNYKEPDEVAAAVEQALFAPNPKHRYMVVPSQQEAEMTIRQQIRQLVQLNADQPYAYSRDALVKLLDEALADGK
jgi:NAD(P)-dependent dehydrogenase (short-subunit alcohol dehydrogenase family)